jgi:hypothetical protein
VEYRILGSVCVSDGDRHIPVRAAKQRALLAILLLNANEPVAADRLIDQLCDGRPPATARKVLQTDVSKLSRVTGDAMLITCPAGYELRVGPGELDLHRFQALVAQAREASPREAARLLRRAVAEWRGPPPADLRDEAPDRAAEGDQRDPSGIHSAAVQHLRGYRLGGIHPRYLRHPGGIALTPVPVRQQLGWQRERERRAPGDQHLPEDPVGMLGRDVLRELAGHAVPGQREPLRSGRVGDGVGGDLVEGVAGVGTARVTVTP